jgi:hypothetical protein
MSVSQSTISLGKKYWNKNTQSQTLICSLLQFWKNILPIFLCDYSSVYQNNKVSKVQITRWRRALFLDCLRALKVKKEVKEKKNALILYLFLDNYNYYWRKNY